jgi:hypothetical protein
MFDWNLVTWDDDERIYIKYIMYFSFICFC